MAWALVNSDGACQVRSAQQLYKFPARVSGQQTKSLPLSPVASRATGFTPGVFQGSTPRVFCVQDLQKGHTGWCASVLGVVHVPAAAGKLPSALVCAMPDLLLLLLVPSQADLPVLWLGLPDRF
jgi:hypothetical protein